MPSTMIGVAWKSPGMSSGRSRAISASGDCHSQAIFRSATLSRLIWSRGEYLAPLLSPPYAGHSPAALARADGGRVAHAARPSRLAPPSSTDRLCGAKVFESRVACLSMTASPSPKFACSDVDRK
jgi:hypothetical protein